MEVPSFFLRSGLRWNRHSVPIGAMWGVSNEYMPYMASNADKNGFGNIGASYSESDMLALWCDTIVPLGAWWKPCESGS